MNLKKYLSERPGEQARLAEALGVSRSQMSQMVNGTAHISYERCVIIEKFTNGKVSRKDLKSNWRDIWPELDNSDNNK